LLVRKRLVVSATILFIVVNIVAIVSGLGEKIIGGAVCIVKSIAELFRRLVEGYKGLLRIAGRVEKASISLVYSMLFLH